MKSYKPIATPNADIIRIIAEIKRPRWRCSFVANGNKCPAREFGRSGACTKYVKGPMFVIEVFDCESGYQHKQMYCCSEQSLLNKIKGIEK